MNVTTQAALAAEYKMREWCHGLAGYGTTVRAVKCQTEYLFRISVGQLHFLGKKQSKTKQNPTAEMFRLTNGNSISAFQKKGARFDFGE